MSWTSQDGGTLRDLESHLGRIADASERQATALESIALKTGRTGPSKRDDYAHALDASIMARDL